MPIPMDFRSLLAASPAPAVGRIAGPAAAEAPCMPRPPGSHAARLSVECADGHEIVLSVLLDRGRLEVRIEAPDPAASAWVEERVGRIREEVARAGLDLVRLDLGRWEHGSRQDRGREEPDENMLLRRARPSP